MEIGENGDDGDDRENNSNDEPDSYLDKDSTYKILEEKELLKVYPSVNHDDNIGEILRDYNTQIGFELITFDELQTKVSFNSTWDNLSKLIRENNFTAIETSKEFYVSKTL